MDMSLGTTSPRRMANSGGHLSRRTPSLCLVALVLLIVTLLTPHAVDARRQRTNNSACPDGCFCNPVSNMVYCSRRGLSTIPRTLPADSQQLNLNGNLFTVSLITRSNFTGLTSLAHLYLSECGIERIEVGAFVDMVNLQWLDLSNNRIARIEAGTFTGLNLMNLFLNGNRNLRLASESFIEMQTTGLYLHECSLSKLSFDVFAPLNGTLQNMWLHANEIETIDKKFRPLFSSLVHLRLGQNPLHCNCESLWLKEFYDTRGTIFQGAEVPTCLSPEKLKAKAFNEISLFDFTCISPVFKNIDAVIEHDRGVLTCRATGDPTPTLFWIGPSGLSSKYKPARPDSKYNEAVMNISHRIQNGDDISGQYFCLAINEGGNMTFTFNVSMPRYGSNPTTRNVRPHSTTQPSTTPADNEPSISIERIDNLDDDYWGDSRGEISDQDMVDIYNIIKDDKSKQGLADNVNTNTGSEQSLDTAGNTQAGRNNAQHINNHSSQPEERPLNPRGVYSLGELIGAIVGTFVCTVLLCLLVIPCLLKRLWWNNKQRHKCYEEEKPALKQQPPEPVYTAPIEHTNYYTGKMPPSMHGYHRDYRFESPPAVCGR